MIKEFKDILALLLLIIIIPGIWIFQGLGYMLISETVIGATIMAWGLVLQYYFRKKNSGAGTGGAA